MTAEAWTFAGLVVTNVTGVTVVWLKLRKTRVHVDQAKAAAQSAADLSRPTGNGWAAKVLDKFDHLEKRFDHLDTRLDRIENRQDRTDQNVAGLSSVPRQKRAQ